MIPPGGYGKALDMDSGRAYSPIAVPNIRFRIHIFIPDEEPMGSTPNGNANPMISVGLALPRDRESGRDGKCRVSVGGRT